MQARQAVPWGLLCILRAGPRKTTCLSARANFKMIYRLGKTKFFAILRGFAVPWFWKARAMPLHMQLYHRYRRFTRLDVADRLVFYVPSIQLGQLLKYIYVPSSHLRDLVHWTSLRWLSRETLLRRLTIILMLDNGHLRL